MLRQIPLPSYFFPLIEFLLRLGWCVLYETGSGDSGVDPGFWGDDDVLRVRTGPVLGKGWSAFSMTPTSPVLENVAVFMVAGRGRAGSRRPRMNGFKAFMGVENARHRPKAGRR